MGNGKLICDFLKRIRKIVAKKNGINLISPDCDHEGPCNGSCPACDAEVEYLEKELRSNGKTIKPVDLEDDDLKYSEDSSVEDSCRFSEVESIIRGAVYVNSQPRVPIPGACVINLTTGQEVITGHDGYFEIPGVVGDMLRIFNFQYCSQVHEVRSLNGNGIFLNTSSFGQTMGIPAPPEDRAFKDSMDSDDLDDYLDDD